VEAFDAERGLGTVVEVGGASFGFHSTAISDGSRQIAVGSRVAFVAVSALGGRFEAASVHPLDE
jgi:cold shock CspA family protein